MQQQPPCSHGNIRIKTGHPEPVADAQRDLGGVDSTRLVLVTNLKYLRPVEPTRSEDAEFPISHEDTPPENDGNKG